MISVPSRQLLSSGSKFFVFFFLTVLLSACGGTEKVTKRSGTRAKTGRSSFPPKKKKKTKVTKIDTVQWTEVKTTDKVDNTSNSGSNYGSSNKKDHYNISMLIPLESSAYNNTGSGNQRMINYYAGAKIALDLLEQEGANLTINTIDVGNGGSITTKLREAESADVIIGPYKKDDLKKAAEFAKKEEITLVSPWIALGSKTIKDNPYFVQLRPTALDHYQMMVEHASQNYKADEVVLLTQEGNSTDANRAKYIQKLARTYFRSNVRTPLAQYDIPLDSLKQSRMLFYDYLALEEGEAPKTKVFLIPNMNSKDESFIYGAIRRLTAERGQNNVVVYGMPIVLDSEKLTFDNYNGTSAHVVTSNFVDNKDREVSQFKSKYYDTYGAIPSNEAYEGYDMMLYIGRALMEHGSSFQYKMNKDSRGLLQGTIALYPKYQSDDEDITTGKKIDYFANKNIDVVHFKNNRFQRK